MTIAQGTPRWAVWTAWVASVSVIPSALWRTAAGFGAELGMPQAWRDAQQIPGPGTTYVLTLTVLTVLPAAGTLLLVHPLSDRFPRYLFVVPGVLVGILVLLICTMSTVAWNTIIGFAGMPEPAWYALATAAYLPAWLWGPCLLATVWAYWRRRSARH